MTATEDDNKSAADNPSSLTTTPHPSPSSPSSLIPALSSHRHLVILHGSQTGCAAELGHRLSLDAFHRSFTTTVLPLDSFPFHLLPSTPLLIIITSTQGNADPPTNARSFYRSILRRSLPPSSLSSCHFSVFGLGDSGYPIYNAIGRRIYQRMLDLGAVSICRRGLGDDQDQYGYEEGWEEWRGQLWKEMREKVEWLNQIREEDIDTTKQPPPLYTVRLEERNEEEAETAQSMWCPASSTLPVPCPSSSPLTLAPVSLPPYSSPPIHPYPALLTHNRRLTPLTHFQDVRHLRLSLPPSAPSFLPGDIIDIFPRNDPALVTSFLRHLSLPPSTLIHITPLPSSPPLPSSCTLQELFELHLDLLGTPKRSFFSFLALHATDPMQRDKLTEFTTKEGQAELHRYCQKERRTYAEVLMDFGSARPPLDELISWVPRLQPRSFSISSSCAMDEGVVEVTAALVKYETGWKRKKVGVCSRFIELLPQSTPNQPLNELIYIPVAIRSGAFRPPADVGWGGVPVIMIGPGTGVAPFRAMCQHKAVMMKGGEGVWSSYMLVFGNRNRDADFLYREEWEEWMKEGVVDRVVTAWSRDQEEKVYVQDRMVEDGVRENVYEWVVKRRGVVMVAGSSGAMPREVRRALVRVLMMEGGMEDEEAQKYLKEMERTKRYIQETW